MVNLDIFNNNFNIAIFGKTNSGKTVLLKYLLMAIRNRFQHVFMIIGSKTSYTSNNYWQFIYPDNTLFLDDKINVKESIKNFTKKILTWSANNDHRKLVIFDDIGDKSRDCLDNFTNECRHGIISTIFLVHAYKHLDTTTRYSLTHIIITPNLAETDEILKTKKDLVCSMKNIWKKAGDIKVYIIYDMNSSIYYLTVPEHLNVISDSLYVLTTEGPYKDDLINIKSNIDMINMYQNTDDNVSELVSY